MSLRIIMLGDIVGKPGRQAVRQVIPQLKERYNPDLIIANGENAANGSGLTPELYRKLCDSGIDGITLGDHVYKKKQIVATLEQESNIIRPANLPPAAKGRQWMKLTPPDTKKPSVYVITLLGRIFMSLPANDPFAHIDHLLAQLPERDPIVIVEMHCEATSEKQAMGWYLNGRVTAVLGSHTHVPTADACILKKRDPAARFSGAGKGTAFVCDLGMCGPFDSVIGRSVDPVLAHMTTTMHYPYDVPDGDPRVCGVLIDIDAGTGGATAITRIDQPADTTRPPFV